MYRPSLSLITIASASVLTTLLACSGSSKNSGFDPDDPSSSGGTSGTAGSSGSSGILGSSGGTSGSSGAGGGCVPNPANAEIAGNNCDDDGDGMVDNVPVCDSATTGADPADFAKTMGLCADATTQPYGLVSATFTQGYQRTDAPKDQQHSALAKFGNVLVPREGSMLGVLSTGYAQEYDGSSNAPFGGEYPNGMDWWGANPLKGNGTAPPGFPKNGNNCGTDSKVNDTVDLHLTIKAPANATGFQFDFNFFSGEWPAYICSTFNDSFVAYLSAAGFNGGKADNMSFDTNNNPISVNNNFFDRCTDGAQTGCEGKKTATASCPAGTAELGGTGFGVTGQYCSGTSVGGGATGWLTSKAAVNPGETFTLDLMIWDTGDGILDSSVLIDNFQWIGGAPVTTSTDRPH